MLQRGGQQVVLPGEFDDNGPEPLDGLVGLELSVDSLEFPGDVLADLLEESPFSTTTPRAPGSSRSSGPGAPEEELETVVTTPPAARIATSLRAQSMRLVAKIPPSSIRPGRAAWRWAESSTSSGMSTCR
jgi:hypothetical protein